jgi:hypothetical protein
VVLAWCGLDHRIPGHKPLAEPDGASQPKAVRQEGPAAADRSGSPEATPPTRVRPRVKKHGSTPQTRSRGDSVERLKPADERQIASDGARQSERWVSQRLNECKPIATERERAGDRTEAGGHDVLRSGRFARQSAVSGRCSVPKAARTRVANSSARPSGDVGGREGVFGTCNTRGSSSILKSSLSRRLQRAPTRGHLGPAKQMLRLYDLLYQLSYRLAASIEAKDKAAVCFAFLAPRCRYEA